MPNWYVKLYLRCVHVGKNSIRRVRVIQFQASMGGLGNCLLRIRGDTVSANMVWSHRSGGQNYGGILGCQKNLGLLWPLTGRSQGDCVVNGAHRMNCLCKHQHQLPVSGNPWCLQLSLQLDSTLSKCLLGPISCLSKFQHFFPSPLSDADLASWENGRGQVRTLPNSHPECPLTCLPPAVGEAGQPPRTCTRPCALSSEEHCLRSSFLRDHCAIIPHLAHSYQNVCCKFSHQEKKPFLLFYLGLWLLHIWKEV